MALPSWPARFQDPEFRAFVESLFNNEAPAHLCFQFLWLGVEKMNTFESAYFPWLDTLRSGSGIEKASEKPVSDTHLDVYKRQGEYGVYSYEGLDRKGKVKQLRAYLFFFGQILANYLSQLENISNFFSSDLEAKNARSLYYKPLYHIRGANEILACTDNAYEWDAFIKDENNAYIHSLAHEQESVSDYRSRKHKVFELSLIHI